MRIPKGPVVGVVLIALVAGCAKERTTTRPSAEDTSSPAASPQAAPSPTPSPPGVSLRQVTWETLTYPLGCSPDLKATPLYRVETYFTTPPGSGEVALILVQCNVRAGSTPWELYVYDRADSPSSPHLLQTLLDEADLWQVGRVSADGATVRAEITGYSSPARKDVHKTATWTWDGTAFKLAEPLPPHYRIPSPSPTA